MFRERRAALAFPAAPTEAGGGRVGREKSSRHFVLLTRQDERSPGAWQPRSPKKGIRKFRPGRNLGRRLLLMRTPGAAAEGAGAPYLAGSG